MTFSSLADVEKILSDWPWSPRRGEVEDLESSVVVRDAVKVGFRTLSKARWEQLGQEYLSYGQVLLERITQAEDTELDVQPANPGVLGAGPTDSNSQRPEIHGGSLSSFDISAPYPLGCLVFVRHVHPETNKTTLRGLFSQAYRSSESHTPSEDVVDYVDFNKGAESVR